MKKILLWTLLLILLAGTGLMLFGVILPVYFGKKEIILSGPLTMEQSVGGWLLSWPDHKRADRYQVELLTVADGQEQVIYREFVEGANSIALPELPEDMVLSVQIRPAARFRTLFGEDYHYSETVLEARARFENLPPPAQTIDVNGDDKTVTMELPENTHWQYQLVDASGEVLAQQRLEESVSVLQLGKNSDIALPGTGESYGLRTRLCREEPNLVILGKESETFAITEESLQFRKLNPRLVMASKNTVQITWGETRGDHYEVQILDPDSGSWNTASRVKQGETRRFQDLIEPGQTRQYRVMALDDQGNELMVSEEMTATGRDRVQYATVWPVMNLEAYSSARGDQIIGAAKEGTAYCVLAEEGGRFAVRINDRIGYIDSDYCMINLPEYIGGLCSYDITNSYYSIYAIHEFAIENVTGVITRGYEDIRQDDGSYLVPLLYPAAKRLLNAAKSAWEQGYRLKIYDSYRPRVATLEIYNLTSKIMNDPVQSTTHTGVPREEMELPEPKSGMDYLSLGWLMTGYSYEQNSFLAKGGSAHNQGVALDLTLEKRETGEELRMQTTMHDLSQFSVLGKNNEEADLLGSIMKGAGFAGLISEWWHFQDDHARNSLRIPYWDGNEQKTRNLPYVNAGVDAQCWVKDDTGWKYRDAKGSFYRGRTLEISGTQYTFDDNGYVIE